jgi:hypothetical protein
MTDFLDTAGVSITVALIVCAIVFRLAKMISPATSYTLFIVAFTITTVRAALQGNWLWSALAAACVLAIVWELYRELHPRITTTESEPS